MTAQQQLDLKIQLTNEYLRSGGTQTIQDPQLLQDLIDFRPDRPETHTSRLRALMNAIFQSNLTPPYVGDQEMPEYKSTLQKSLFFDQTDINTEAEFDAVYEQYRASAGMLFRGQREAAWRLYNKLQRFWVNDKMGDSGLTYEDFLENLTGDGRNSFEADILSLLEDRHVDVLNEIAILGFLQHHGCPTPLMDWTYSFGNALYFAMDGLGPNPGAREIGDYFSVYFIEEENMVGMRSVMETNFNDLGQQMTGEFLAHAAETQEGQREMEEYFRGRSLLDIGRVYGSGLIEYVTKARHMIGFPVMFFSDKDADSGFIFSLNNSQNILHQQGVFVWSASPYKPLEVVGQENYLEDDPGAPLSEYRFCECFNINKQLAPYIRARLEADGINQEHIYPTPDIDSWGVFERTRDGAAGLQ